MKHALVLVAVLLLACSMAWAEEPTPKDVPAADSGGGCMLPDFTGMSPDQITAAALAAGFQIAPTEVQVPPCPTTFLCSSIINCGAGTPCAISNIGQCCLPPSGPPAMCCINGIKQIQCPCVCTGSPCSLSCPASTEVRLRC